MPELKVVTATTSTRHISNGDILTAEQQDDGIHISVISPLGSRRPMMERIVAGKLSFPNTEDNNNRFQDFRSEILKLLKEESDPQLVLSEVLPRALKFQIRI